MLTALTLKDHLIVFAKRDIVEMDYTVKTLMNVYLLKTVICKNIQSASTLMGLSCVFVRMDILVMELFAKRNRIQIWEDRKDR